MGDQFVIAPEITAVLQELSVHKAAGPDNAYRAIGIPAANVVAFHLTELFHLSLTSRKLMTTDDGESNANSKEAVRMTSSYCSVCLLPLVLKLMERCMQRAVSRQLIGDWLLTQNQQVLSVANRL